MVYNNTVSSHATYFTKKAHEILYILFKKKELFLVAIDFLFKL